VNQHKIKNESVSALLTPDKHKTNLPERCSLPFWEVWLVTSRE
jgi:hypothetical protein